MAKRDRFIQFILFSEQRFVKLNFRCLPPCFSVFDSRREPRPGPGDRAVPRMRY